MFQFTTTTILNSAIDSSGKAKFTAETSASGVKSFFVKRVNNFIADNVTDIYKREATNPKKAKAELVLDNWGVGVYQLVVEVNYLGSQNSYYARSTNYIKGKPLFYSFEITGSETSTQIAQKITKIVKHLENRYGDKWLDVTNSTNTLSVEAVDEYQRFVRVAIEQYQPLDNPCACATDCQCGWVSVLEAEPAIGLEPSDPEDPDSPLVPAFPNPDATLVQGREGFGTYTHLMKDLRLPTAMNTNWLAVNQEERPVPGALYNQYTLYYVKNRGIMGQSAVGQLATSSTAHVFYVKEDLVEAFEDALTAAGLDTKLASGTQVKPTGYPA